MGERGMIKYRDESLFHGVFPLLGAASSGHVVHKAVCVAGRCGWRGEIGQAVCTIIQVAGEIDAGSG